MSVSEKRVPDGSGERCLRPARGSLSAPCGLESFVVEGDPELVLLSWPAHGSAPVNGALSPAENEVLQLVCTGLSNAEIAARRQRSLHTIANQVASIFAKLGVGSRAELFAAHTSPPRRSPDRP